MYVAIACFPGCDVINFEIYIIFLTKPFFKFKYLENKRAFLGEIKSIF